MAQPDMAVFSGLIDLAAEALGGRALTCSDDFFASMHNLVKPGRGVFIEGKYTDFGKWMDGWESRRKREPGHDFCVIALGARGRIRALDIDTNHFLGNHPPFASVDARESADAEWVEILRESPLRPGSQNLFTVADERVFSEVRLNIFPDGGVARLRVYGEVVPTFDGSPEDDEVRPRLERGHIDLAAVVNGGKALACSDSFFGPMDNLLLPGRAENMGGGWETRRKRPNPGHDWILIRLGVPGNVSLVELDTNHFKGNYPDRCALHGIHAPGARLTELVRPDAAFVPLLPEVKLSAHTRHFFDGDALVERGPFSHVRLDIFPDGGISRLRIFGARA